MPLFAEDHAPRSKASDYPVHVAVSGFEIAAEYLLHSIPTGRGFYVAKGYLVVDVGVFPAVAENIKISSGQFTLRVNHGKQELTADSPGMVAGSLKYPDWEQQQTTIAQVGPVVFGPPAVGRFPGDRREGPPVRPPAPEEPDPGGAEEQPPKTIDELIARAALPEGPTARPVKGCLFFRFRGKTKTVRSLELVYDGGVGGPKATLPLF